MLLAKLVAASASLAVVAGAPFTCYDRSSNAITSSGDLVYWTNPATMSSTWSAYGYSETGHVLLLTDLTSVTPWTSTSHCNPSSWSHAYESLTGAILWDYWIQYNYNCAYNQGVAHPDGGDSYYDALAGAGFIAYMQGPYGTANAWGNIVNHETYFAASNYLAPGGGGYPLFYAIPTQENVTNSGINDCLYTYSGAVDGFTEWPPTSLASSVRVVLTLVRNDWSNPGFWYAAPPPPGAAGSVVGVFTVYGVVTSLLTIAAGFVAEAPAQTAG